MSETGETVDLRLIEDAAERLNGLIVRTPLLESAQLNEVLGMRLLFKPECLQRTGSFKFRGAYTKLSRISPDRRKKGVVAYSSGNHAQGVAAAARFLGMEATILMPSDAPRIKIDSTRSYGARVVFFERHRDDRRALAEELVASSGATLVPPFDDPDIISGQGTAGLEITRQADYMNIGVDDVICPVGGGGLLSGIATAVKARMPLAKIWCAEPEGYDDVVQSISAGQRISVETGKPTLCDSIATPQPGEITFEIIKRLVSGGFVVSDRDVTNAVGALFDRLKLVVEPGGSAAFAAVVKERERFQNRTVVVVLSGGNVDRDQFATILIEADGAWPA
ncbi:threonine ammonia-lyase [Hoeflea prorocentri]|uniref:Threonine/serine dehydratase n=1 Tax=Hoeflea prorocentri TaxID=1922333 RepID=A0A9X3UG45_9HYPH|nr:threonine/serine dehydratase [Hoeflea prorocentri]MCY6380642.1 threonine/serine dehydratase [Hoeflea prorocentri]MDA5398442.1 threonine/serine dehydratase [Hoeflea prorocentri]